MGYWTGQRVLVTGGTGFVGTHLVERLLDEGAQVRVVGRHPAKLQQAIGKRMADVEFLQGDLCDPAVAAAACHGQEAVFNLVATVTGVGYNTRHPGTMFTHNLIPAVNVVDAAAHASVSRLLCVSSICVYRRHCTVPTPESEGFMDDPEPTNIGYGWAKRALEIQARCYAMEFPIKIAIVRPYNVYGPRDNFDWETSHVIPALIRKAVEGHDPIVVWGDGTYVRSFLYVTDLVEGMLRALEHYAVCDPVNIGTDEVITIGDLAQAIVRLTGSQATLSFDTSRPSGQAARIGDFSKAQQHLGFRAAVPLEEGLRRTIAWYMGHRAEVGGATLSADHGGLVAAPSEANVPT